MTGFATGFATITQEDIDRGIANGRRLRSLAAHAALASAFAWIKRPVLAVTGLRKRARVTVPTGIRPAAV